MDCGEKMEKYINLTLENIEQEHVCCIIRSKAQPMGVLKKKEWLKERLKEGHVFRKLNDSKATVFIEYAPLEKAWVPIEGNNYIYIYCLWTLGEYRHKGYGKELLEYAIEEAKNKGKSGLCFLGHMKQKTWLTNQDFFKGYGFKVVDETSGGYQVLALSFDGSYPKFSKQAKNEQIEEEELTIFYTQQCPYIPVALKKVENYCKENQIPFSFILVDSLEKAKNLPCPFNNFAVFYKGHFETVNLLDIPYLERILKK